MKTLFLSLAALASVTGCGSTGENTVVVSDRGTLVVDWTIDGAKDGGECRQGAATTLDVTVQTADGGDVGEFQADCGSFATSIDLPAGSYVATAVLIDDAGNDRTTPIDIDPFRIHGSDELTTPIDFPADSFL
ncbi:MAG TPA: hypothetical protein VH062_36175 [Polyangiaceae bacterium]|jgi:hypothetical protein|nr:hypothetical protein [Polyangiaceae bacterium]